MVSPTSPLVNQVSISSQVPRLSPSVSLYPNIITVASVCFPHAKQPPKLFTCHLTDQKTEGELPAELVVKYHTFHHHTTLEFPFRTSIWIGFNLQRSKLESNVEFLCKPSWEDINVSEILFFPVQIKESKAQIILTSKNNDRINKHCAAEFIITRNLSLSP